MEAMSQPSDPFEAACLSVYPDQPEPLAFRTRVSYADGGPDPLDEVRAYRANEPVPHWHFVGRGSAAAGVEFSIRVAAELTPDAVPPAWPPALLQQLARHVLGGGEALVPGSLFITGRPIVAGTPTEMTALIFSADSDFASITTEAGPIQVVQAITLTGDEAELAATVRPTSFLSAFEVEYPKGVIDLGRASVRSAGGLLASFDES